MAHIIDVLSKYLVSKKAMVGILVFIIFIVVIIWWMKRRKSINVFDDVANSLNRPITDSTDPKAQSAESGGGGRNSVKEAIIYFFHADWCPHCKTAKPYWEAFKAGHHNKVVKGYKITCQSVDCTNDKDQPAAQMINRFNVDSYPTIKMVKDNTTIDYDSKVTQSALTSFVDIMLA
jgi:thiol-disulfide isomerase/thioredoxin